MAHLADIPFRFYNAERDEYRLPGGQVVEGHLVRQAARDRQDQIDAGRAYDPYNHTGRSL